MQLRTTPLWHCEIQSAEIPLVPIRAFSAAPTDKAKAESFRFLPDALRQNMLPVR